MIRKLVLSASSSRWDCNPPASLNFLSLAASPDSNSGHLPIFESFPVYLDSYDFDERNPDLFQEHHLKEIEAAYSWLHKNSVVMIDDCDLPYGGKGKLVIEFLLERGCVVAAQGYQVILVWGSGQ